MKQKVKISLSNGEIIMRVPKAEQLGNFVILTVRYNNDEYIINDGDEYLRGYPSQFTLGKKIEKSI